MSRIFSNDRATWHVLWDAAQECSRSLDCSPPAGAASRTFFNLYSVHVLQPVSWPVFLHSIIRIEGMPNTIVASVIVLDFIFLIICFSNFSILNVHLALFCYLFLLLSSVLITDPGLGVIYKTALHVLLGWVSGIKTITICLQKLVIKNTKLLLNGWRTIAEKSMNLEHIQ